MNIKNEKILDGLSSKLYSKKEKLEVFLMNSEIKPKLEIINKNLEEMENSLKEIKEILN